MKMNALNNLSCSLVVETPEAQRLDRYLVQHIPAGTVSRTRVQEYIDAGCIWVNGTVAVKSSMMVRAGDVILMKPPQQTMAEPVEKQILEACSVEVIAEHEHFIVLAKPAGLVVHKPSPDAEGVSLVDWLVHRYPEIASVGAPERPGIVHRLDKDTSGLLLVARTQYGLETLQAMFGTRLIKKTYFALVTGHPQESGVIDYCITRNSVIPTQMTHKIGTGRPAITHFRVMKYYKQHALLEVKPLTGRTHQIRVHCAAIGHPIVGDAVYGTQSKLIKRQALHAAQLEFTFDGQTYAFLKNVPEDFAHALQTLDEKD
jgi:23S rRNA pseudouridine1911/1915/1917 synthase